MPTLIELTTMPPRPFTITRNVQLRRLRRLTGDDDLQIGDTSSVGFSLNHSNADEPERRRRVQTRKRQ